MRGTGSIGVIALVAVLCLSGAWCGDCIQQCPILEVFAAQTTRLQSKLSNDKGPQVADEQVYKVVDAIDEVAKETGKTVPQIALNWLLQRPTISSIIVGARNEEQLRQNLGAVGWKLTSAQIAKLDAASATTLAYPYWHQRGFPELNPPPV